MCVGIKNCGIAKARHEETTTHHSERAENDAGHKHKACKSDVVTLDPNGAIFRIFEGMVVMLVMVMVMAMAVVAMVAVMVVMVVVAVAAVVAVVAVMVGVCVGHPSPPASRQAPLRPSQAPSKRPTCSESSAQERDARENFQNAPPGSEIFINMFQDASYGSAIFQNFQDAPHGSAIFSNF